MSFEQADSEMCLLCKDVCCAVGRGCWLKCVLMLHNATHVFFFEQIYWRKSNVESRDPQLLCIKVKHRGIKIFKVLGSFLFPAKRADSAKRSLDENQPSYYVECMFANVSWWTKVICSQFC